MHHDIAATVRLIEARDALAEQVAYIKQHLQAPYPIARAVAFADLNKTRARLNRVKRRIWQDLEFSLT